MCVNCAAIFTIHYQRDLSWYFKFLLAAQVYVFLTIKSQWTKHFSRRNCPLSWAKWICIGTWNIISGFCFLWWLDERQVLATYIAYMYALLSVLNSLQQCKKWLLTIIRAGGCKYNDDSVTTLLASNWQLVFMTVLILWEISEYWE